MKRKFRICDKKTEKMRKKNIKRLQYSCKLCNKISYNPNFCCMKHYHFFFKNKNREIRVGKITNNRWKKSSSKLMKKHYKNGKKIGWGSLNKIRKHNIWKKSYNTQKNNKIGFFNKEIQKNIAIKVKNINKKNKSGSFHNPIINRLVRVSFLRKENKPIFKNILFDSRGECEIAMNLHYQEIIKLKEYINCHVKIQSCEYDFLIKKYKCFIEYHPYNNIYDKNIKLTSYLKKRRNNLAKTKYHNYGVYLLT